MTSNMKKYRKQLCHWIPPWKKCIYWHSSMLVEYLQRPSNICDLSYIVDNSKICVTSKSHSGLSWIAVNSQNVGSCSSLVKTYNWRWWLCEKLVFCSQELALFNNVIVLPVYVFMWKIGGITFGASIVSPPSTLVFFPSCTLYSFTPSLLFHYFLFLTVLLLFPSSFNSDFFQFLLLFYIILHYGTFIVLIFIIPSFTFPNLFFHIFWMLAFSSIFFNYDIFSFYYPALSHSPFFLLYDTFILLSSKPFFFSSFFTFVQIEKKVSLIISLNLLQWHLINPY